MSGAEAPPILDLVDRRIIAGLYRDARQSNRELARRLGLSEATVRRRIERMVQENQLLFTASADPLVLGYSTFVEIWIQVQPGCVDDVIAGLVDLDEVQWVGVVSGAYDIMISAAFRDTDALYHFLHHRVTRFPGVLRTKTTHVLKIMKRRLGWLPPGLADVHSETDGVGG
jgi:Lrp/AsnC family transcriptional regulator for asnA, asnC and gidA